MYPLRKPSIRLLTATDGHDLAEFFEGLARDAETVRFFHPHPLTAGHAALLCAAVDRRKDRYYAARQAGRIVGYSMLRGWDEGFTVPSFGVGIAADARGVGLGQILFEHAIAECRNVGAPALRLSVYKANERAVHIYRKFGMVFQEKNTEEWVGLLDLRERAYDEDPVSQAAAGDRSSTDAR